MKKTIICILVAFIVFSLFHGCGRKEDPAITYYKKAVDSCRPLLLKLRELDFWPARQIYGTAYSGDTDSRCNKVLKFLDENLSDLKELTSEAADALKTVTAYKGDPSLRNTLHDFLEFLDDYYKNRIPDFQDRLEIYLYSNKGLNEPEADEINEFLRELTRSETSEYRMLKDGMRAFAEKYGFQLKVNVLEVRE
jgi:hypothetical protein